MMLKLTMLAGAACLTMGISEVAEPRVGDIFRCESGNGLPPVDVWIGKIEPLEGVGVAEKIFGTKMVHLQMFVEGRDEFPKVGRSPFSKTAFEKCDGPKVASRAAPDGYFAEGYATWLAAFQNESAGYFTISPAEGYWTVLGVLDENGVRK